MIPDLSNPQSWNRYSYVRNNPIRFSDPTGHIESCDDYAACKVQREYSKLSAIDSWKKSIKDKFGINISDGGGKKWDIHNLGLVYSSLKNIDAALNGQLNSLMGGATFQLGNYKETKENCPHGGCTYGGWTSGTTVTFYTMGNVAIRQMNIYHESGHLLDNSPGMVDKFSGALRNLKDPSFITDTGYLDRNALVDKQFVTNDPNYAFVEAVQHPYSSVDNAKTGSEEHWGDIFANYVAGNINLDSPQGADMNNFITGLLP